MIVAAVDQSDYADCVVTEAEVLAEVFGEPVHVVHVLTHSEFMDTVKSEAKEQSSIDSDRMREVATKIAADAASSLDVPYKTVGLVDNPAERIVSYASEHDARYIVIGGRKRSPAGKALFGSVVQSVLLNSSCPVLTTFNN